MNEVLTRAEMEARFDGEWVLIADPETDGNLEVLRGRVAYHGTDRDAMYEEEMNLRLKRSASLYFGETPEHIWLNAEQFYQWGGE